MWAWDAYTIISHRYTLDAHPASLVILLTCARMPAKEKWPDFKELSMRTGPAKHQHSGVAQIAEFRRWECPYCAEVIEAQVLGSEDRKAKTCARHYWKAEAPCPNRPADDLRGQPKPKAQMVHAPASTETVEANTNATRENTEVLKQQLEVQKQQLDVEKKLLATLREAVGISDHSSDDEEKLTRRAKRKMEDNAEATSTRVYTRVADVGKYSPQRDGEVPIVFGRRVEACVGVAMRDAATTRACKHHIERVNERLDLPPAVVPAETMDAIDSMKKCVVTGKETEGRLRRERDNLKTNLKTEREANGSLEQALEEAQTGPASRVSQGPSRGTSEIAKALIRQFHRDKTASKYMNVAELSDAVVCRVMELDR